MTRESYIFSLLSLLKSRARPISQISDQSSVILCAFLLYLSVFKIKFRLLVLLLIIIGFLDVSFRLVCDVYNIFRRKTGIEIPNGLFVSFITISTIVGVFLLLVSFNFLAIGYTVLEFREQGQTLINDLSKTINSRQAQDLMTKAYEIAIQNKYIEQFKIDIFDLPIEDQQACSIHIDGLQDIPIIGTLASDYSRKIDD